MALNAAPHAFLPHPLFGHQEPAQALPMWYGSGDSGFKRDLIALEP